jgi:rod shape-determining protein MreD
MKPRYYLGIFLLIIPVQASLLSPLSLGGIGPDLALALLFILGLLTGPREAALAGMALGLLQDVSAASLIGLTGFTRGLVGLGAGLLGRRMFDLTSPSTVLFLIAFSLAEGIFIAILLQVFYGAVPFWNLLFTRLVPQALYTGLLGYFLLQPLRNRKLVLALKRRTIQREL